jgi:L-lactate dehydrogenase complex protein LldG
MSSQTSRATAREEVLARIRTAQGDPGPVDVAIPREYHGPGQVLITDPIGLLADRLTDYRATVTHCTAEDLGATITSALASHGARRVITPPGLPDSWRAAVAEPVIDDPVLSTEHLDTVDAVLTTVALAVAQTGTLILDHGPGQGRRALTLVPDLHVAVVHARQIVAAVPDAVAAVDPTRTLTWISGPSATSDIELNRVEGVHGPRTLHVIIAN